MSPPKSCSLLLTAIAVMIGGCATSPQENFRAEYLDACAKLTECGIPDDSCNEAGVDEEIDMINRDAMSNGRSEGCIDQIFDSNASFFACLNRQTCEALDTGNSCQDDFEDQGDIVAEACGL